MGGSLQEGCTAVLRGVPFAPARTSATDASGGRTELHTNEERRLTLEDATRCLHSSGAISGAYPRPSGYAGADVSELINVVARPGRTLLDGSRGVQAVRVAPSTGVRQLRRQPRIEKASVIDVRRGRRCGPSRCLDAAGRPRERARGERWGAVALLSGM